MSVDFEVGLGLNDLKVLKINMTKRSKALVIPDHRKHNLNVFSKPLKGISMAIE